MAAVKRRFTCGEIILEKTDKYAILCSCILCDKEMSDISEFIGHMLEEHINNVDADEDKQSNEYHCHEQIYDEDENDANDIELDCTEIEVLDKVEIASSQAIQLDPQDFCLDIKMEDSELSNEFEQLIEVEEGNHNFSDELQNIEVLQSPKHSVLPVAEEKLKASKHNSVKLTASAISVPHDNIKQLKYNRYKSETEKNQKNDKGRTHACEFCDAVFRDASNLIVHRKRHLGKKTHACQMCEKSFISTTELKHHTRSHTSERPFVCEECGLRYFTSSQLTAHRRRHTNERPYVCEICNKRFFNKCGLEDHSHCHTKDRAFQCSKCGSRFPRRKALAQHMKLHSGVKNYVCKICEKAFAQYAGLYSHMKQHNLIKKKET